MSALGIRDLMRVSASAGDILPLGRDERGLWHFDVDQQLQCDADDDGRLTVLQRLIRSSAAAFAFAKCAEGMPPASYQAISASSSADEGNLPASMNGASADRARMAAPFVSPIRRARSAFSSVVLLIGRLLRRGGGKHG